MWCAYGDGSTESSRAGARVFEGVRCDLRDVAGAAEDSDEGGVLAGFVYKLEDLFLGMGNATKLYLLVRRTLPWWSVSVYDIVETRCVEGQCPLR